MFVCLKNATKRAALLGMLSVGIFLAGCTEELVAPNENTPDSSATQAPVIIPTPETLITATPVVTSTPDPSATEAPVIIPTPEPLITATPVVTSTPRPVATPTTPPAQPVSTTIQRSEWILASSNNSAGLENAIDGDTSTRWTTMKSQEPDQWLTVDLGAVNTFNQILLDSEASENDYPRSFQLYLSSDGIDWGTPVATGVGSDASIEINFDTSVAKHIRIVQMGSSDDFWWSIHELNIFLQAEPTPEPTATPTSEPTPVPTATPTSEPTAVPTPEPTAVPTPEPTAVPMPEPTTVPTPEPSPTATPGFTPALQLGKDNYDMMCAACHGEVGLGGIFPEIISSIGEGKFITATVDTMPVSSPDDCDDQCAEEILAWLEHEHDLDAPRPTPTPTAVPTPTATPEVGSDAYKILAGECSPFKTSKKLEPLIRLIKRNQLASVINSLPLDEPIENPNPFSLELALEHVDELKLNAHTVELMFNYMSEAGAKLATYFEENKSCFTNANNIDDELNCTSIQRPGWTLASSNNSADLENAIDGDTSTRWTTQNVQGPNQWLTVDLGAVYTFNQIVLDSEASENDYPRSFELYLSSDGIDWGVPVATGIGSDASIEINFDTSTAKHIRIVQTGSSIDSWWSIHELDVFLHADTNSTSDPVVASTSTPTQPTSIADDLWSLLGNVSSYNEQEFRVKIEGMYEGWRSAGDKFEALEFTIVEQLMSMDFLFRRELGVENANSDEWTLSSKEAAIAIHWALAQRQPDSEWLTFFETENWKDPSVIAPKLKALLEDSNNGIMNFLDTYFLLGGSPISGLPETTPSIDQQDIVLKERLSNVIQSDNFMFMDIVSGDVEILKEPSLISRLTVKPSASPVTRGHFVASKLLCKEPPGITVDFDPLDHEDFPDLNPREVLEFVHLDPGCKSCHEYMDPFGFTMDVFDVSGNSIFNWPNGSAIDTNVEVNLPGLTFNGEYENLDQLTESVVGSPEFYQCMNMSLISHFSGYEWEPDVPVEEGSQPAGCDQVEVDLLMHMPIIDFLAHYFTSDAFNVRVISE